QGQWVGNEHKDVFFQRIREGLPVGAAGEMRYAGFWVRFVAAFLDGLILGVINIALMMVTMLFGVSPGGNVSGHEALFIILTLVRMLMQYAIAIAYDVFFIRKYDATPGKMALGLKVLRANGEKLSAGRIIGRYFAKAVSALILCIGYMMAGWDDQKRALHDMMCDTRVVHK
ncbi:MAG: RDD family protein, partial [Opitutaceae bacterium]|nr:RDD family protein [Opitutaceae bacterium]